MWLSYLGLESLNLQKNIIFIGRILLLTSVIYLKVRSQIATLIDDYHIRYKCIYADILHWGERLLKE